MKKLLIVVIAVVVIGLVGFGGFEGGRYYERNQANQTRNDFLRSRGLPANGQFPNDGQFQGGGANAGQRRVFGGGVTGQIKSIDGKTITVTTAQNTTTVTMTDATQVQKSSAGTVADLQPGDQVLVTGQRDASGNVTAVQILIMGTGATASSTPTP